MGLFSSSRSSSSSTTVTPTGTIGAQESSGTYVSGVSGDVEIIDAGIVDRGFDLANDAMLLAMQERKELGQLMGSQLQMNHSISSAMAEQGERLAAVSTGDQFKPIIYLMGGVLFTGLIFVAITRSK